jgi:hypothetical protein
MNSTNSTHYDTNGWLMGVGGYDFFINVTAMDGSQVYAGNLTFAAGLAPVEAKESISLMRTVIFNEDIVRVNFIIWV